MISGEGTSVRLMQHTGYPLDLEHEAEIEACLRIQREKLGRNCLSDLAFSNLYLFRSAHAYRYLPGPYPCIGGVSYDGARHLLPLFDLTSAPHHHICALLENYDCFFPVAGELAALLSPEKFTLSGSPDDADYLYPSENFRSYRGERLRKKRQLMQQLTETAQVHAHALTKDRITDAFAVLSGWMRDKNKAAGEADELSCRDALLLSDRFGFDSSIYYVNGQPAGFLIAQRLSPSVAVMRFAKGIDSHKGIYQYMFHHFCTQRADVEWINFEQDLGLSNFRQTKRSYQPCALLEKVRVKVRL